MRRGKKHGAVAAVLLGLLLSACSLGQTGYNNPQNLDQAVSQYFYKSLGLGATAHWLPVNFNVTCVPAQPSQHFGVPLLGHRFICSVELTKNGVRVHGFSQTVRVIVSADGKAWAFA